MSTTLGALAAISCHALGECEKLSARHPRRARFAAALAVDAAYEWVLRAVAMPMVLYWEKMQLIDRAGVEGNRMRLATTTRICVGAFALFQPEARRLFRVRGA